jgi:homoserine/homoserine lactone efflux protein
MNWHLFAGFLLITVVLILTPGPIVTLVISTGATRGVRAWRSAARPLEVAPGNQVHFGRGFLVALSNPKTIAFFTAFLPQFVDPARPAAFQLAVMCVVSLALAAVSDSCWAIASGLGRAWFMRPARVRLLTRASALALIGGGVWLSISRRPA